MQAEQMEVALLSAFLDLVEKVDPETAQKWCEVLERVEQVLSKNKCITMSKERKTVSAQLYLFELLSVS